MNKFFIYFFIVLLVICVLFFIFNNYNKKSNFESDYSTEKLAYISNSIEEAKDNEKYEEPETFKIISEFSTDILSEDPDRLNNIQIATLQLNGTIVESGKEFSFCDTLGPAKESDGYKEADILNSDGTKTKGLGGGKCQLSTTLYNAILLVPELEVTERHEHSKKVNYVEPGMDATVAYDYLDLKFINHLDSSIKIYCYCTENNLIVQLLKI